MKYIERVIELLSVLLIYIIERVIDLYYQPYNLSDKSRKSKVQIPREYLAYYQGNSMRDNQGSCHRGVKGMPRVMSGEHHDQCQGNIEKKAFEVYYY